MTRMARLGSRQQLMPTILDRLIDPEMVGAGAQWGYTMSQMIDAVRRDVEELLNTRQTHQGLPDEFVETHRSIVSYGLPDFTSMNVQKSKGIEEMGEMIESVIGLFEPRLRNIRAIAVESAQGKENQEEPRIRFNIEATLFVDPFPEVGFSTVVELLSGQASIALKES
jgi:type VI secretion system protein ImpF